MSATQNDNTVLYGKHEKDCGNTSVQIAYFTRRISHLTGHLQIHKKDQSTRLGLLKLVGKRRRLLNYLQSRNIESYRELIKQLNIRR